jgi:hypothetical protein
VKCTVAKLLGCSVAKLLGSDVALLSCWGLMSVLTGRNMFIDFEIGGTSKKKFLGPDVKKLPASSSVPDPEVFWPLVSGSVSQRYRSRSDPAKAKNINKNLDFYCFATSL